MKYTFLFILVFLLISYSGVCQLVTIKGSVRDSKDSYKLSHAIVSIIEINRSIEAGDDGEFKFKDLSVGVYTLVVEYSGYDTAVQVINATGQSNDEKNEIKINVSLNRNMKELKEVILFNRINNEDDSGSRQTEKKANNIVNVISAQSMQRSPDINAANVLQRMSGLTIQHSSGGDEAYAIIRGLDPRYSNTLINGIKIASPDEKSRFVPLNIIPSDLLASIEVHKSLLPEMEGDAVGGTVNMIMKDAPDKKVFNVLGSLGYSKIFIDRKFDYFSRDDIQQKSVIEKYGSSYTAQPSDFSRSNLDFKPITPLPTGILGITYGQRFLHSKLGFMIAENFQNQYYGSNSIFNQAAPNPTANNVLITDYATRAFSTQQLNNGLVVHMNYDINNHNKVALTNVFLYSFLAQARTIIDTAIVGGNGGRTVPGTGPISTDNTSVTSHQYIENIKLEGKHILTKHFLFDWTGAFSIAIKRTPDFADLSLNKKIDTVHTTNDINGPYTFVTTPNYFDEISRIWQHNEDKDIDVLGNLTYKTKLHGRGALELKAGGLYRHKTRYNIQDEYDLKPTTSSSGGKQIFYNIDSAQWLVYNSKGTYDYDKNNYRLFEDVAAGYGEFKISFPSLDFFGGVRVEETNQGYTLNTFYPTGINGITKNYTDVLPSAMVKIKINNRVNLRASYFKSISRPNYYEIVPANIASLTDATITTGNPYLKHSIASNYDIRYEFYPKDEEQFFAGVFYKQIQDPIEYAYISGTTYEPENLGNATIYGAELQFTKYLGNFGVTGNYTYLSSQISSPKSYSDRIRDTSYDKLQKRPLQGMADNTVNLSLLYRSKKSNLFIQLSYQYVGKILSVVYPVYGEDYYQQPQSFLALSGEKGLKNKHFTVFTKLNNLLNTATNAEIANTLVTSERSKLNFSFGIRYSN
jgi:outer membrane receptor protein involved in Fe transport